MGDGEATFAPSTPRNATPEEKSKALAQATTEESGVLVWGGRWLESRPLVKKLAKALDQTDTRGLKVDSSLRVEGADGVYAIGDAALSGFAPTAQVAAQQGKHIGRSIRDATDSPFAYKHAGSLTVRTGMALPSSSFLWRVLHLTCGKPLVRKPWDQMETSGPLQVLPRLFFGGPLAGPSSCRPALVLVLPSIGSSPYYRDEM